MFATFSLAMFLEIMGGAFVLGYGMLHTLGFLFKRKR